MCFCKFCNPAFQGQLFFGNKLGAAAHAEARSALSLPASHLDHQGTASFLTFSTGRFFGGLKNRQRCGKTNANVEMTGRRKNSCMFDFVAYCPKFIMVNAFTGRLQVKVIHKASPKFLSGPLPAFVHFLSLSCSTFPPNLCRKLKTSRSVYINVYRFCFSNTHKL